MAMVGTFSCHTKRQKSTTVSGRGPESEGIEEGRGGGRKHGVMLLPVKHPHRKPGTHYLVWQCTCEGWRVPAVEEA